MSGDMLQTVDIASIILETTNSIYSSFLSSIDKSIFPLLDKLTFINIDITKDLHFEKIFGTSSVSGVLLLANSLLVAFVLYYCIRLIISRYTGNEIELPDKFFFRVIISMILVNSSLEICRLIISCIDQVSSFFLRFRGFNSKKRNII